MFARSRRSSPSLHPSWPGAPGTNLFALMLTRSRLQSAPHRLAQGASHFSVVLAGRRIQPRWHTWPEDLQRCADTISPGSGGWQLLRIYAVNCVGFRARTIKADSCQGETADARPVALHTQVPSRTGLYTFTLTRS